MIIINKLRWLLCWVLCGIFASSSYAKELDYSKQRKLFLQAETELKKVKGHASSQKILQKYQNKLNDYPLYPYLQFITLQRNIGNITADSLNCFTAKYADSPLSAQLRKKWLLHKASKQNWSSFLKGYRTTDDLELNCHFLHAKLEHDKQQNILPQVKAIWLSGKSQPKACDVVFKLWKEQGMMTKAMVWQRIKLAIQSNNKSLARFIANTHLPKAEQPIVELWLRTKDQPYLVTKPHYFTAKHPAVPEILMYGILKIAKKEPNKAIKIWNNLSKKHKFSNRHFCYFVKTLAIMLARNSHKDAKIWLNKIPKEHVDDDVRNLKLVTALKNANWGEIFDVYDSLPNELKQQEKWRYWYARALEMHGQEKEGQALLRDLAKGRSYYGFLASVKLLQPYNFSNKTINVRQEHMQEVLQNMAVTRAYELIKLNRVNHANLEWNLAIKNMQEVHLHAAAKLADSLQMPNWSILALSDAKDKNDLSLRFPKHHADYIVQEAKHNKLDPAWVFAVTRQESAFRINAKSSAGALGLMQIIPKTGFKLAKEMELNVKKKDDLLQVANNVKLGSKYLNQMLDKYKNLIVATAAYNAGPTRIQQWLPEYSVSSDIWVETIPFKETREYVQNVLTYMVIYQKLLGTKNKFNMYLPIVLKNA